MTCDNCHKKRNTKQVSIITGKRGRPPIRNYCDECIKSENGSIRIVGERVIKAYKPGKVQKASPAAMAKRGRPPKRLDGFNSAAAFLLNMHFANLFESTDRSDWQMRCKGCGEIVKRTERQSHHNKHRQLIAA